MAGIQRVDIGGSYLKDTSPVGSFADMLIKQGAQLQLDAERDKKKLEKERSDAFFKRMLTDPDDQIKGGIVNKAFDEKQIANVSFTPQESAEIEKYGYNDPSKLSASTRAKLAEQEKISKFADTAAANPAYAETAFERGSRIAGDTTGGSLPKDVRDLLFTLKTEDIAQKKLQREKGAEYGTQIAELESDIGKLKIDKGGVAYDVTKDNFKPFKYTPTGKGEDAKDGRSLYFETKLQEAVKSLPNENKFWSTEFGASEREEALDYIRNSNVQQQLEDKGVSENTAKKILTEAIAAATRGRDFDSAKFKKSFADLIGNASKYDKERVLSPEEEAIKEEIERKQALVAGLKAKQDAATMTREELIKEAAKDIGNTSFKSSLGKIIEDAKKEKPNEQKTVESTITPLEYSPIKEYVTTSKGNIEVGNDIMAKLAKMTTEQVNEEFKGAENSGIRQIYAEMRDAGMVEGTTNRNKPTDADQQLSRQQEIAQIINSGGTLTPLQRDWVERTQKTPNGRKMLKELGIGKNWDMQSNFVNSDGSRISGSLKDLVFKNSDVDMPVGVSEDFQAKKLRTEGDGSWTQTSPTGAKGPYQQTSGYINGINSKYGDQIKAKFGKTYTKEELYALPEKEGRAIADEYDRLGDLDNAGTLQNLNIPVNDATLYMAHNIGPALAAKIWNGSLLLTKKELDILSKQKGSPKNAKEYIEKVLKEFDTKKLRANRNTPKEFIMGNY